LTPPPLPSITSIILSIVGARASDGFQPFSESGYMSMEKTASGLMVQRLADIYIIEFLEKNVLDQVSIERMKQELIGLVEKSGHPKFIISFENVTHISSAMLGVLMVLNKRIRQEKGELRLAAIGPQIMEVFKLTRLDKALSIYNDIDKAMVKF
jgi:anti-sigma B factor antagonist